MKTYILNILVLLIFLVYSCKEIYSPEINGISKVLVVEGLITNEPVAHTVHLSKAIRFDTMAYIPETGSNVYVSDNNGNKFYFKEKSPGYYFSDPLIFIPQVGTKYVLTVETRNKNIYQSSEQELLPIIKLNDVTNRAKWIRYYLTSAGLLQYLNVKGTEFYTDFDLPNEKYPYFRFSNAVLLEYFSYEKGHSYYCWKKQNLNDYLNLNNIQYNHTGQFQQDMGFCPIDTLFFSIRHIPQLGLDQNVYKYFVSFKQYHLNEDIHRYFELLNTQLEAKQRIFDPISFQIEGNMKCVTDTNEKVFGLFEASSINVLTYEVDYNILSTNTSYELQKVNAIDFDSISNMGTDSLRPKSWIY